MKAGFGQPRRKLAVRAVSRDIFVSHRIAKYHAAIAPLSEMGRLITAEKTRAGRAEIKRFDIHGLVAARIAYAALRMAAPKAT